MQFACFLQKQCPDQVIDFANCMAANEYTSSYCQEEKRNLWMCHAYSQAVSLNFLPITHSIWSSGVFQLFHLKSKTSVLEDYFSTNPAMKQPLDILIALQQQQPPESESE